MWSQQSCQWQQEPQVLAVLSTLSYQAGELSQYLQEIACSISQLLSVDWSVVTLCQNGFEKVLASSLEFGEGEQTYSLHGTLTGIVIQTGHSLVVPDARICCDYGQPPEGYWAYLGVPLRTPSGAVIGTICCFHREARQFLDAEVQIAEIFAERVATAIDNYHLYQQQQQFNQTLEAEVTKRSEELLSAQIQLVEQERLAAIGEFTATIVHEIRNPLTTIMMGLNYFQRVELSEPASERLALAVSEVSRLERLLHEILLYSKPQVLQLTELELNEFITALLDSLRDMAEAQRRKIEFAPTQTGARVLADPDKLKQVFINLVRNACEAVAAGETVSWTVDDCSVAGQVCIQIHNGGNPIPVEILPRLTEPFYTTKSSGTGLGLAIVKRIVVAHSGSLSIQSTAEVGTTVSVRLPAIVN